MENKHENQNLEQFNIPLYGIIFTKPKDFGDFDWMCKQPEYSNALFIFNDNEEHHNSNKRGMGNAIVRPYNKFNKQLTKPKSAGIPTGTMAEGGYQKLTPNVTKVVSESINEIKELLTLYEYDSIYYSVGSNGKLGTGLFNVNSNVIDYIDQQIKALANNFIFVPNKSFL